MYSLGEDPVEMPWPPVQAPTEGVTMFAVQKLQEKLGITVTGTYDDGTHAALVAWAKSNTSIPIALQGTVEKWANPASLMPWLVPAGMQAVHLAYASIAWKNWKKSKQSWFGKYWWTLLVAGGAVAGVVAWKKSRRS